MKAATVTTKFLAGSLGLVVFLGLGIIVFIRAELTDKLEAELQARGLSIARAFAAAAVNPLLTENALDLQMLAREHKTSDEDIEYLFVQNARGVVVAHTFGPEFPVDLVEANALPPGKTHSIRPLSTVKGAVFDIAAPVEKGELGTVHVGVSAEPVRKGVAGIIRSVVWIVLGVLAFGSAVAIVLTVRLTRPLAELAEAAATVGSGELGRRVAVKTRDEIGRLAETFNKMVDNLQETTVSRVRLEDAVQERTSDLSEANERLLSEITERRRAEEEIGRLNRQKELILNSAGEGVYGLDRDGDITFINPAAAKMVGWTVEELVGRPSHALFHHSKPDGSPYPREECPFHKALISGAVHHVVDEVFWRKDGTSFPIEYVSTPMRENGAVVGAVVAFKDTTERRRAEEALRDSEQRFRALFGMATDGIILLSPGGDNVPVIVDANNAACVMNGYAREELVGKPITFLEEPRIAEEIPAIVERLMAGTITTFERSHVRKDGSVFPVEVSARTVHIGGKTYILAIDRDITERKRAEEALHKAHNELELLVKDRTAELTMMNEQLRNLSTYLQDVREKERTMVAREIHDELGQSLTALKMDLSLLKKRLPRDQKPVNEKVESMAGLIEATIRSVKRISTELRPGMLDHLGLTAAIKWHADEFKKRTGISCAVVFEPEEVVLDRDRTTTVFRIFQETLTNVARHAKATKIAVLLRAEGDALLLQVKDNGKGITEKQLSDPKSLGLIGIRERVHSWGGSLTITGARNKGTTVTVRLPLVREEGSDTIAGGR